MNMLPPSTTTSTRGARSSPAVAKPSGTQSIQRVIRILTFLSAQQRTGEKRTGARLNQIATEMDLELPTAHRMLKCLVAERMLAFDPATREYRLGTLLYELGLAAIPTFDIRALCQPAITRLAARVGDTFIVTARSEFDGVCVARQEGPYPIKTFTVDVGTRRPLGIGAGGLAILAALPDDEVASVVAANALRLRKYDTTTSALKAMVGSCRRTGYAVRDVEIADVPGVRAIGVPVFDPNGRAVAALSVVSIAQRLARPRQQEIVALMAREAEIVREAMRA